METGSKHFLIGGGIASLAAAALLVREAGVDGRDIQIIEQADLLGGSLDGAGTMESGFSTRGGRMFEKNFVCTFDLFDTIPTLDDPSRSVSDDIRLFNREVVSNADCRLVRDGRKVSDRHRLTLSWADRVAMLRLMAASERRLEGRTIESWFRPSFFDSNFWILWSTMFSFAPWHSLVEMRRYMRRFIHLFPGLSHLRGVLRTRYNQYDSLIVPLREWLAARGVTFRTGQTVADIAIEGDLSARRVTRIGMNNGEDIAVASEDRVYITLGSMTDGSSLGSNDAAPSQGEQLGPAGMLWTKLARDNSGFGADSGAGFGRPEVFLSQPRKTIWHSFTVTLDHPEFHRFMEEFSGSRTGVGGLVTFADSGWMMSIVMFHQPHFSDQPPGSYTFWGYGLYGQGLGDAVRKPMSEATGREILAELAWQLRLTEVQAHWFDAAIVMPCRMPFITSQFLPRSMGDRPPVHPKGAQNFALMGQFCEVERDCVFTVEYSVRSAWEAVRSMTGKILPPPPVVRSDRDPMTILMAAKCLLRD